MELTFYYIPTVEGILVSNLAANISTAYHKFIWKEDIKINHYTKFQEEWRSASCEMNTQGDVHWFFNVIPNGLVLHKFIKTDNIKIFSDISGVITAAAHPIEQYAIDSPYKSCILRYIWDIIKEKIDDSIYNFCPTIVTVIEKLYSNETVDLENLYLFFLVELQLLLSLYRRFTDVSVCINEYRDKLGSILDKTISDWFFLEYRKPDLYEECCELGEKAYLFLKEMYTKILEYSSVKKDGYTLVLEMIPTLGLEYFLHNSKADYIFMTSSVLTSKTQSGIFYYTLYMPKRIYKRIPERIQIMCWKYEKWHVVTTRHLSPIYDALGITVEEKKRITLRRRALFARVRNKEIKPYLTKHAYNINYDFKEVFDE